MKGFQMKSIKYFAIASLIISTAAVNAMLPKIKSSFDIYGEKEEPCSVTRPHEEVEVVPEPDVKVPDDVRAELRSATTNENPQQETSQTKE